MYRRHLFAKVLIGLLIAVSVLICLVQRTSDRGDPRFVATNAQIQCLKTALQLYVLDCGVSPTTAQGLIVLVTNPGVAGWKGPYIDPPRIRSDPWGTPFRYRLVGTNMVVESAGPDGKFGTADDF
jgi:general secretion pathway protein G